MWECKGKLSWLNAWPVDINVSFNCSKHVPIFQNLDIKSRHYTAKINDVGLDELEHLTEVKTIFGNFLDLTIRLNMDPLIYGLNNSTIFIPGIAEYNFIKMTLF